MSPLDNEAAEESDCEDDVVQDEPADSGNDSKSDGEEGGPNKFSDFAKDTSVT
jgi:hypothetical protein